MSYPICPLCDGELAIQFVSNFLLNQVNEKENSQLLMEISTIHHFLHIMSTKFSIEEESLARQISRNLTKINEISKNLNGPKGEFEREKRAFTMNTDEHPDVLYIYIYIYGIYKGSKRFTSFKGRERSRKGKFYDIQ